MPRGRFAFWESLVELADSKELCRNPRMSYTQALLSAVPIPNPWATREQYHAAG